MKLHSVILSRTCNNNNIILILLLQGSGLSQPVDDRIIRKIDQLVNEGVKDTHEMRRHLNVHVKNEILSKDDIHPPLSNRRFYPKLSDIRSHMYRASIKHRFSKIDQENVAEKVLQWKTSSPNECASIPECVINSRLHWKCHKCRSSTNKMRSRNIASGVIKKQK